MILQQQRRLNILLISLSPERKFTKVHDNAPNNILYATSVKIHQFKAKGSKIKPYPMRLGDISKSVTVSNRNWI